MRPSRRYGRLCHLAGGEAQHASYCQRTGPVAGREAPSPAYCQRDADPRGAERVRPLGVCLLGEAMSF
jgi:hypothetical protein